MRQFSWLSITNRPHFIFLFLFSIEYDDRDAWGRCRYSVDFLTSLPAWWDPSQPTSTCAMGCPSSALSSAPHLPSKRFDRAGNKNYSCVTVIMKISLQNVKAVDNNSVGPVHFSWSPAHIPLVLGFLFARILSDWNQTKICYFSKTPKFLVLYLGLFVMGLPSSICCMMWVI